MAETATLENELKVSDGWRYQCWKCNRQVKIDKPFPETCPGCHAGGWWGHLVTPATFCNDVKKDGDDIKNSVGGINSQARILSQEETTLMLGVAQNNGVYGTSQGRGRGRPSLTVPEDLIMELKGLSSRQIAANLGARGFHISYKSVQRYLRRQKQGSLL